MGALAIGNYAGIVGLDWADTKHDGCLVVSGGEERESFKLKQKPEAIDAWVSGLRKRFDGKQVAIILEQSRGALIYALMKYDFLVLYPVNPKTLAKFREAFSPSGTKDDPTDAELMVELLLKHIDKSLVITMVLARCWYFKVDSSV
ncbi:hypothetical protein BVY02_01535 [bacterium J17]|nr:hypothetical protein BVY02_01535 [bacterium J17]